MRGHGRFQFLREVADCLFEIGVVSRQRQRRAVLHERLGEVATPMMDLGHPADRGKIFRRAREHPIELALSLVELVQFEEGPSERDPRGQIAGVKGEAGAADVDRFLALTGTPELFGELRKRNRRRIFLDPASKVFEPLVVGHVWRSESQARCYGMTVTGFVALFVWPRSSVTIRITVYTFAVVYFFVGDTPVPRVPSPKSQS